MLWRQKPLGYDPKDFPNYNPYPQTKFHRLLSQWPLLLNFIVWSFTFLFSILTIINEWFWMVVRDPLHYDKANAWIIEQYQSSPTVSHMTYAALITLWFFQICLRVGFVLWATLLEAYNDPACTLRQVLDLADHTQTMFFRSITYLVCAVFNFTFSTIVLLYNMSIHSLSGVIILLGGVALFQLHYYLFVYKPEENHQESSEQAQKNTPRSQKTSPESRHQMSTPAKVTPIPITPYNPPWRSPGRCYRVPTPSTGSTISSCKSSDSTTFRRRPSPKSNKPPGASYVKVSPKAVEKLRADGYGVPEPTREATYSWIQPMNGERLTNLRRSPRCIRPGPKGSKEIEEKKAEAEDEAKFVRSIVPTKTQWVYSSLDAVERHFRIITDEITDLNAQVKSFKEDGTVRPISEPSDDLPASPRTQQREATLAERERIKLTMADHIPRIENAAMAILKQQHGVEELLNRIENLIAKAGDPASRAMGGELEDYRIKIKNMFGDARQTLIRSRNIEELCEDRRAELAEEANRLKRLDRAHLLLLQINAKKAELQMY